MEIVIPRCNFKTFAALKKGPLSTNAAYWLMGTPLNMAPQGSVTVRFEAAGASAANALMQMGPTGIVYFDESKEMETL